MKYGLFLHNFVSMLILLDSFMGTPQPGVMTHLHKIAFHRPFIRENMDKMQVLNYHNCANRLLSVHNPRLN